MLSSDTLYASGTDYVMSPLNILCRIILRLPVIVYILSFISYQDCPSSTCSKFGFVSSSYLYASPTDGHFTVRSNLFGELTF